MNIAKLVSKSAKEVVIQIKVSLSSSMLESEENIRSSVQRLKSRSKKASLNSVK